ncbi:MAG: ATP-binding protein [Saprospiraceae bacterium]
MPYFGPTNLRQVRYKPTLFLFLCTIVLVVLCLSILFNFSIKHSEHDSRLINVAGSQRMYSQKMAKTALRMLIEEDVSALRTELKSSLDELERQHWGLLHGHDDHGMSIKVANSPTTRSLFDTMQEPYNRLSSLARQLIEVKDKGQFPSIVNELLVQEAKFLPLMDAIVANYEKEAEQKIQALQREEIIMGGIMLLVTLLSISLLIFPLLKKFDGQYQKINKYNQDLAQQKIQLLEHSDRITEENEYLTIAKQKAEEATHAKSNFLSNMSHEIRTPMNAVIGMTHILLEEDPRADQKDQLETIMFSAENLLVIINDILDYSKIEAGRLVIEKTNFDINDIINNIYRTFAPKAKEKQLIFQLDLAEDIPQYLIGDPTRLSQILINLLNNAIKFTEKGKISLTVKKLNKPTAQRCKVYFEVNDTGIGIPKEKHRKIFDSFSQADDNTTRLFGGTGLGLAITKRLIELQGGSIKLESEVGNGAAFSFSFEYPIGEAPQENPVETRNILKQTGISGVKRILIVEDNIFNIKVVKRILKFWDLEIDVALDGLEALEKVKETDYSVVLMDLQMPNMDGYEATATIRSWQESKFQSLPIIALSASAMADFRKRAFDAGMNDFLTKPFKPKDLYLAIERHAISTRA